MGFDEMSTRDRVFMAAIGVFAENGFAGATVREICKRAGSANMNVVNYYFGGKTKLYRAILEMMFAENGARMRDLGSTDPGRDPEQRLCDLIRSYCAMLFADTEIGPSILAIFNNEMAQPSAFLDSLIDQHLVSENLDILRLIDEIAGPGAPRWLLQDCGVSVFSQIMYYSTTWVIYSRVNPDHPGMRAYHEHLADHVCRFSLAGIRELRRAYEAGELTPPDFGGEPL